MFRKTINQSPEQENLKHRYDLGDTILPVLGVITTLSQHLNTPLRENSWVTTKPSSSPIPFWTYQHYKETLESHKCNDYITCCFDGLSWLALISVVNKEKTSHASSSIRMDYQVNFTGLVVMIGGTYP